jgi:hypothetical protein
MVNTPAADEIRNAPFSRELLDLDSSEEQITIR